MMEYSKLSVGMIPAKQPHIIADAAKVTVGMAAAYGTEYVLVAGRFVFISDLTKVYFLDGGEAWQA